MSAQRGAQKFNSIMTGGKKKSSLKTSKGYRLKDSTHILIEKIQILINGSKDAVISRAVRLYYNQINIKRKNSVSVNKKANK
ncbi:MAG TPA: hypothetical protein PKC91_12420 [Ignavibacteria bacterium]|nr:hypothetical protein [Ignavibacteria bacterium]